MVITKRPGRYSDRIIYSNIEPELQPFDKGDRVLPASEFNNRNLEFTLIKRYDPDDNISYFPNGGFEVRGPNGEIRSYDLDEIIKYPYNKKYFDIVKNIIENTDESIINKGRGRPPKISNLEKQIKPKNKGKRGRPPLSEEEKIKREQEKAEKQFKTKGKKGRPPLSEEEKIKREHNKKNTLGKRGRPPLSEEEKIKREQEKAKITAKSKGKRGRPRSKTLNNEK